MLNEPLQPIGGYFELELPPRKKHFHTNSLLLNSGRSCFVYTLVQENVRKVYIPYYSCNSLLEPLMFHGIKYEFYNIDENFELIDFPLITDNEKLLYINYYGLKTDYIKSLADQFSSSLIIDNTQAFYELAPPSSATFYSPRKFFGVPDGGILILAQNQKAYEIKEKFEPPTYTHLIGRIEHGAQAHFEDYKKNEEILSYNGINRISNFSERLLASIDYGYVKDVREKNFIFLHENLGKYNGLQIETQLINGPFCYPFLGKNGDLRKKLIQNVIFVPTYWNEVIERLTDRSCIEISFVENILPLPIDQRYGTSDLDRIIDIIKSEI